MVEFTALCGRCDTDEGIDSIHFDTMYLVTIIKLTCGHRVKVETQFRNITEREYLEMYPDEERNT